MIAQNIKDLVKRLHGENKSYREIAHIADISIGTVYNIVKNKYKDVKKKPGPKSKITKSQLVAIKRKVANMNEDQIKVSSNKIRDECSLSHVTSRTVRTALRNLNFNYLEVKQMIKLTKKQRQKRVELATLWLNSMWPWDKVIWSDEKRFNLDGPDSYCTWGRKDQIEQRDRRQQGGASVQIWGMLMPDGSLIYKELHQRSNSSDYIDLLKDFVKPQLDSELDGNYVFQQDNAAIHTSAQTLTWMDTANMPYMEWPSRSPDLNPIENVWSLLSSIVYDGKQYRNTRELRNAIEKAVNQINQKDRYKVMNIRDSIQKRLLLCVLAKGDKIKY